MGKVYGKTATAFAADAIALALADAGLEKADVDGLLIHTNASTEMTPALQMSLGFTDLTLIALAEALPTTDTELLAVSGVGLTKLERYGADVMAICAVAPGTRNAAGDRSGDPVGNG